MLKKIVAGVAVPALVIALYFAAIWRFGAPVAGEAQAPADSASSPQSSSEQEPRSYPAEETGNSVADPSLPPLPVFPKK